jgi:hypothetical protein
MLSLPVFFFGFIFPSSFGGKDRQAAHAGGDYSKLIVEIGFGQTAFPDFGNYFSMFMAAFWILL